MLTDAVFFSLDIENVNIENENVLNSYISSLFSKNIKITDSTIRNQFINIIKEKLSKSARIIFDNKVYFLENVPPKYAAVCEGKTIFKYSQKDKVPDSIRGKLENQNGFWKFTEFPCDKEDRGGINFDKNKHKYNQYKRLILVLESPHEKEYTENGAPLLPAQGITGTNIVNYIEKKKNIISLLKDHNSKYIVLLVNPVQYPVSCFLFWNPIKKNNKQIKTNSADDASFRHKVFEILFCESKTGIKKDFKKRINSYYRQNSGDIVICCTTKPNREIITKAIQNDAGLKISATLCHPSSAHWKRKINKGIK